MKLPFDKIQELFPSGKLDHRGKNWITNCPECGEREFSISLDENHLCGCFRGKCSFRGNIFSLMKKIGRVDILINKDIKFDKLESIKLISETDEQLHLDIPDIPIPMGWKRIYTDPYLELRHFDQYDRYKVGISAIHPKLANEYVIFLIEEQSHLKGYIARSRKSKAEIDKLNAYYKQKGMDKRLLRYSNSITDFSKLLFGLDELTEQTNILIIVEGIFDKFNIDRLLDLHNQQEVKCIATFKCSLSKEQIYKIQQFKNIDTVILLYDPDVIDQIKKTAFEAQSYFPKILIGFSLSGHDPGDFDTDDVQQVFSDLQTPSAFNINHIKLNKLSI